MKDRAKLIDYAKKGDVTLVVGAGVSQSWKLPSWADRDFESLMNRCFPQPRKPKPARPRAKAPAASKTAAEST